MKIKFFDLARKVSLNSSSEPRLGCVIAQKNKVINIGFNNMRKTHPKSPHPYQTLHAEIHALIGSSFDDTKGATVYLYREKKDGSMALSKPCPSCLVALKIAGVKKVYYTSEQGYLELDLKSN